MILALILQATSAQPLRGDVWAAISRSVSLTHSSETVELLRDGTTWSPNDVIFRLTSQRLGKQFKPMWANGRTCAGAVEAAEMLRSVPMPTPLLPSDPVQLVLDGADYQVRIPVGYGSEAAGHIELSANFGTPLAQWVTAVFAKLKPCWTESRPR